MPRKHLQTGIFALTAALWRAADTNERLRRLLEQAVRAAVLAWALGGFMPTDGMPYSVFLFAGLAPWFYFREILYDSLERPRAFLHLFDHQGYDPAWFAVCQAVSALPTLLFWTLVALLTALFAGMPLQNVWLLPYLLLCNVCNAVAQGMFAAAFVPLFPGVASVGLAVSMPFIFWTTPIAWPLASGASEIALFFLRLNPLYYLAEGMRGWLSAGVLPPLAHTVLFVAAAGAVGLIGLLCIRRVWRAALRA